MHCSALQLRLIFQRGRLAIIASELVAKASLLGAPLFSVSMKDSHDPCYYRQLEWCSLRR